MSGDSKGERLQGGLALLKRTHAARMVVSVQYAVNYREAYGLFISIKAFIAACWFALGRG